MKNITQKSKNKNFSSYKKLIEQKKYFQKNTLVNDKHKFNTSLN